MSNTYYAYVYEISMTITMTKKISCYKKFLKVTRIFQTKYLALQTKISSHNYQPRVPELNLFCFRNLLEALFVLYRNQWKLSSFSTSEIFLSTWLLILLTNKVPFGPHFITDFTNSIYINLLLSTLFMSHFLDFEVWKSEKSLGGG